MSLKLDCPDMTSKMYWSTVNRFLNKKGYQIYHLSLLIANLYRIFIQKSVIFNQHLVEQCMLVQNTSTLPVFNFKRNNQLKSLEINENGLLLVIKNHSANKAHGWDNISIRMIQYRKSTALPLKLLFKTILEERIFPEDWKIK